MPALGQSDLRGGWLGLCGGGWAWVGGAAGSSALRGPTTVPERVRGGPGGHVDREAQRFQRQQARSVAVMHEGQVCATAGQDRADDPGRVGGFGEPGLQVRSAAACRA